MQKLIKKVESWGDEKGITNSGNTDKQFMKFIEEVFEFKAEMDEFQEVNHDIEFSDGYREYIEHNLKLEMGDIIVTLIILSKQLDIDLVECLEMAYEKISQRKGKTIDGMFVKEEDL